MIENNIENFNFKAELKRLPQKPGVYIFRDKHDIVIYVGKAINLKSRLSSYFQPSSTSKNSPERIKVLSIQAMAAMFEYIVTGSELEALILECNLIKEYMPRYNVRLKDDKSYPYIKLSIGDDFPCISMAHNAEKDKSKYFGPFTSTVLVNEIIELVQDVWPVRKCQKPINSDKGKKNKERACLNYHIGKCLAPCCGHITKEDYRKIIQEVSEFLSGRRQTVIKNLESKMIEYSENLEFEKAGEIRNRLQAIKRLEERQSIETISKGDHDVIAFAKNDDEALIQVFFIRDGKMTGREQFIMTGIAESLDSMIMQAFLTQFYSGTAEIPKELIIECDVADKQIIGEWFKSLSGRNTTLVIPQRGDKFKLLGIAKNNAEITLAQSGERIRREKERTEGALSEIVEMLGISGSVNRIEAYDISNISGHESVASMVVFEGGRAKRSDYRKFRIKSVVGFDDYASMQEVLTRRFNRYEKEKLEGLNESRGKFSKLPDVIFVDGGKGQVSATEEVLKNLGAEGIPVCGMIKDDRHRTRGLIYNNEEYNPKYTSEGFKLITRIQDEVHRFAVEYHRKLREKEMVRSILDDIPGVGAVRRKALLKFFGSIDGIETAEIDTLMKVEKMNEKTAKAIYNFFAKNKTLSEED